MLYICLFRYIFAKTTLTGFTTFYALLLNSSEGRVYFEYHPEGLSEGFRTLVVDGVDISDGTFHHFAVSVYGVSFALYLDGRVHNSRDTLLNTLEDGPGILYLGTKLNNPNRFSGTSKCMMRCCRSFMSKRQKSGLLKASF